MCKFIVKDFTLLQLCKVCIPSQEPKGYWITLLKLVPHIYTVKILGWIISRLHAFTFS